METLTFTAPVLRGFFLAALIVLMAGCASQGVDPEQTQPDSTPPPITFYPPATTTELVTTPGDVFVNNLSGTIRVMQRRLESRPSPTLASRLISELLLRYRILGQEPDLDRADVLARRFRASHPDRVEIGLHQANIASLTHRFAEAETLLNSLPRSPQVDGFLREIYLGTGRFDAAEALTKTMDRDLVGLANRGNLAIQKGHYEEAARLFHQAQFQYRGVSPLIISWLHVQHGVLHLRTGRNEDARAYFAAAHERLPQYFLATEHLAESEKLLGNLDTAARLYDEVIAQTDNPQFMAALAEVEQMRGNAQAADAWQQKAATRFNTLLAARPAAWWGHAAEFFVDAEPGRALEMARANADRRGDIGSWILLAEVALDAGEWREGCEAVQWIRASDLRPPEKEEVLRSYSERCEGQR